MVYFFPSTLRAYPWTWKIRLKESLQIAWGLKSVRPAAVALGSPPKSIEDQWVGSLVVGVVGYRCTTFYPHSTTKYLPKSGFVLAAGEVDTEIAGTIFFGESRVFRELKVRETHRCSPKRIWVENLFSLKLTASLLLKIGRGPSKKKDHLPRINFLRVNYCWWLKSCTTWDVWNPTNNGKNYLSTVVTSLLVSGIIALPTQAMQREGKKQLQINPSTAHSSPLVVCFLVF